MRRNTPGLPKRVSRTSMSKTTSKADDPPRKTGNDNDGGDVCLDNDLGAEWTGNMDCDDGVKNKQGRR